MRENVELIVKQVIKGIERGQPKNLGREETTIEIFTLVRAA